MPDIIVRPACEKDFEKIHDLQRESNVLAGGEVIAVDEMHEHVTHKNGIFLVAEAEDEIIGFIFGEKLVAAWVIGSYYAVRNDYRGTDAFRLLGREFLYRAKEIGGKHVFIYADAENRKLIDFYKRYGFGASGTYVEMIKEI